MATGSREPGVGCREAGVTVVELAVILVIIGVVALSLIPLVGNVMEVLRAKGAAEQVAATMRLARQYAISTGATYAVNMTSTTIGMVCDSDCPATLPPNEPTATILHGGTLLAGDDTALATPLKFDRTGGADTIRQILVRVSGEADARVCVTVPGRIVRTAPGAGCPT